MTVRNVELSQSSLTKHWMAKGIFCLAAAVMLLLVIRAVMRSDRDLLDRVFEVTTMLLSSAAGYAFAKSSKPD